MRRPQAPIVIVSDSFTSAHLVLILLIAVIPTIAVYVWTALALSAVFGKIGQEPWRAWVPIVNQITLVMVGGLSGWYFLLILIPGLGALAFWVVTIVAVHRINRGFGLGGGMTALAAVLFPVWASIVGFGVARWRGTDAAAAAPAYARTEQVRVIDPQVGAVPASDGIPVPPPPAPSYAPPPLPGAAPASPVAEFAQSATPEPSPAAMTDLAADPADLGAPDAAEDARHPAPYPTTASAWAPPPPPPSATPTAPVPTTAADEQFAPPAAGAPAPGQPVPWTPVADAAVSARADHDFDHRWPSGIDEVSAISQPPQGDPVAARPVATGLPALVDAAAAAGPERGRLGDDAAPPAAASAPAASAASSPPPQPAAPLRTAPVDIDPAFPSVTRAPAGPPRTASVLDPEFPLDTADEVSAVAGAPVGGAPRSALNTVAGADAPADDDVFPDHTVVARRRRVPWMLQPASGSAIDLRSDVVIVGRQPAADPAYRTAQLVAVADDTRTVSKTHARLELRGDRWIVTDLGSTNGVMLPTLMGTEIEAEAGAELAPGERFLLGDAAFRLLRTDG